MGLLRLKEKHTTAVFYDALPGLTGLEWPGMLTDGPAALDSTVTVPLAWPWAPEKLGSLGELSK